MRLRRPAEGPCPGVSVVVPVLDGGAGLLRLLAAASEQVGLGAVELLIADSGSRDGAVVEAMERFAQLGVWDVPPGTFDHHVNS